jgi:hypothetical protein
MSCDFCQTVSFSFNTSKEFHVSGHSVGVQTWRMLSGQNLEDLNKRFCKFLFSQTKNIFSEQ